MRRDQLITRSLNSPVPLVRFTVASRVALARVLQAVGWMGELIETEGRVKCRLLVGKHCERINEV